jgi:hypothetical protein
LCAGLDEHLDRIVHQARIGGMAARNQQRKPSSGEELYSDALSDLVAADERVNRCQPPNS